MKIGDVVQLKSGGVRMTVCGFYQTDCAVVHDPPTVGSDLV